MNTGQHEWLTPAEVASTLRISGPTTYRLISSKALPAVKVGGQLRISRDDVEAYLHRDTESETT
jgi:excisionase family DNA binding protein